MAKAKGSAGGKQTTATQGDATPQEPKTRARRPWGGTVWARADRGGRLFLKYRDANGKTVVKAAASQDRTEAERELARETGVVAQDVDRGVRAVDLKTFTDDELMSIVRSRTVEAHAHEVERHLHLAAEYFGKRPLYSITKADAARYVAALSTTDGGVAPGTLRRVVSALSVAWRTAIDAGAALENVWRTVQLPKRRDYEAVFLTPPQLRKLYANLPEQVHALCIVLAETGGRLGETRALQWHQVADDFSSITFSGSKSKTGKGRTVPLTKTARDLLQSLHKARVAPMVGADPVFPMAPVSKSHVRKLFRVAVKAAELDDRARVHDLRHSYGSGLAAAGVPINVIQKLMGHGSMQMTMRYARWTPSGADVLAVAALEASRATRAKRAPGKPKAKAARAG